MRLKIGILTFHRVYNYGALLQAYALSAALKEHEVEYIDYIQQDRENHSKITLTLKNGVLSLLKNIVVKYIYNINAKRYKKIDAFIKHYIPLSEKKYNTIEELKDNPVSYDLLISGSDQIWNPVFTGGNLDPVYLLDFSKNSKKIAYASSAGSYVFNDSEIEYLKEKLSDFSFIGVREQFLNDQIKPQLNNTLSTVLDPTFLLNERDWEKIIKLVKLDYDYVLLYSFDYNEVTIQTAYEVGQKLGLKVISIVPKFNKDKRIDIIINNIGPQEFLGLFKNAKFICTNSFHGTCFSVNFRKDFFSIYKENNSDRAINLLKQFNLENRLVKNTQDIDLNSLQVDYNLCEEKIVNEVNSSINQLHDSIYAKAVLNE
ncbi:polysaccharide pyruvyl transferase family protein [Leeuwenhoekiella marinoflava]|uniref:polysaccharide pyruvyl transferase family protein n=1 Tax=Leeuwenhoekiella marinoflava TaxID=988 RepID=UPI003003362A